jgi:cytochrome b pre-mRNA-processing protein 3
VLYVALYRFLERPPTHLLLWEKSKKKYKSPYNKNDVGPDPSKPLPSPFSPGLSFLQRVAVAVAPLLGYNRPTAVAIRLSRSLYRACALPADQERAFYHTTCGLPDNFQSWFAITQLHVWMLMVRLRMEPDGRRITQEVVNRFFEDAEEKVREAGVTSERLIERELRDKVSSFHGGVLAYDEGMCKSDVILAGALWRNMYTDASYNEGLAYMTRHVRSQLSALQHWPVESLRSGDVSFSPAKAEL